MSKVPLSLRAPFRYLLIGIPLLVLIWLGGVDVLTEVQRHVILSALLLFHVTLEIVHERIRRPDWWFLSPPTLASLLTFAIPFGLTNILFFGSTYETYVFSTRSLSFSWLNMAIAYAVVASIFMWIGYHSKFGKRIGERTRNWLNRRTILKPYWQPFYLAVIGLFALSTVSKYLLLQAGAYGYGGAGGIPALQQYLIWGKDLSAVCVLVVAIDVFSDRSGKNVRLTAMLASMVIIDVFWGVLAGFKTQVVFPLIIVVGGYYLSRRHLPKMGLVAVGVALFVAYSVVGPYRRSLSAEGRSGSSRIEVLSQVIAGSGGVGYGAPSAGFELIEPKVFFTSVSARLNLTGVAAAAVRYGDEHSGAGREDYVGPRLETILTSPARAVIPRLVWANKPTVSTIGRWFRRNAWGGPGPGTTSVGMSTVGYLYIAGGVGAIAACFLLLGGIQRFVRTAFLSSGGGGLIVYLGLLMPLVKVPNAFDTVIIDIIRLTPLLLAVQYIVIRSRRDGATGLARS